MLKDNILNSRKEGEQDKGKMVGGEKYEWMTDVKEGKKRGGGVKMEMKAS